MRASTLRKEIDKATKELQALKTELPNFERLFRDNQAAETKTKEAHREGDATLEELSTARGRVVEARELLEQHHADIATLEAQIGSLQERYDKQSAGERLAVAKEHHEVLMDEYRAAIRETLNAVQNALTAQLAKRSQVEVRRTEIEELGIKLGIYQKSPFAYSERGARGTNFSRLYPATLPGLFSDSYPELPGDQRVLELLRQITDVDTVVKNSETRQVLAHREATRRAQINEQSELRRAELLATQKQ